MIKSAINQQENTHTQIKREQLYIRWIYIYCYEKNNILGADILSRTTMHMKYLASGGIMSV